MRTIQATVVFAGVNKALLDKIAETMSQTRGIESAYLDGDALVFRYRINTDREVPHRALEVACEEALLRGIRLGGLILDALEYELRVDAPSVAGAA